MLDYASKCETTFFGLTNAHCGHLYIPLFSSLRIQRSHVITEGYVIDSSRVTNCLLWLFSFMRRAFDPHLALCVVSSQ